ncbi:Packaging protein UL32-like protein [Frankliniella fusca]|uniref:Packaging protein UL32-like protein n=1 Tax=Frankliniella fusca TaxID=407009 RepID=A0AAE1HZE6_9NEOP|nr:Packaging protein UL32-like protein [Frankliniella fusca]
MDSVEGAALAGSTSIDSVVAGAGAAAACSLSALLSSLEMHCWMDRIASLRAARTSSRPSVSITSSLMSSRSVVRQAGLLLRRLLLLLRLLLLGFLLGLRLLRRVRASPLSEAPAHILLGLLLLLRRRRLLLLVVPGSQAVGELRVLLGQLLEAVSELFHDLIAGLPSKAVA